MSIKYHLRSNKSGIGNNGKELNNLPDYVRELFIYIILSFGNASLSSSVQLLLLHLLFY